jgi:hypothetical protein
MGPWREWKGRTEEGRKVGRACLFALTFSDLLTFYLPFSQAHPVFAYFDASWGRCPRCSTHLGVAQANQDDTCSIPCGLYVMGRLAGPEVRLSLFGLPAGMDGRKDGPENSRLGDPGWSPAELSGPALRMRICSITCERVWFGFLPEAHNAINATSRVRGSTRRADEPRQGADV